MKTMIQAVSAAAVLAALAGSATAQCSTYQKLNSTGAAANDQLGTAIAMCQGPTSPLMVVGTPGFDGPGGANVGTFAIWAKGQFWSSLGGSFGPTANDRMGSSVDIGFPYVIAGAPGYNNNQGRARVYRTPNSGSNWTFEADLMAYFPNQNDLAGTSVGVSAYGGGWAVVGVPNHNFHGLTQPGAAFFFIREANGTWSPNFQIWGGDFAGESYEHRGTSVAMAKNSRYAVVGGPGGNANGQPAESGVAYVVSRLDNGLVGSPTTLNPGVGEANAHFGQAVAVENDVIVIGAPDDDQALLFGSITDAGKVYIFERNGFNWDLVAQMNAPDSTAGLKFGSKVATDGTRIVVGAQGTKAAYVIEKIAGVWTMTNKLTDPDGVSTFGNDVAVLGMNVAAADMGDDEAGITDRGAVYTLSLGMSQPSDICSTAQPMPLSEFQACTTFASGNGNVASCGTGGSGQGPDIWYAFTPTCSGNAIIDTFGSDFDTVLSVHTGCPNLLGNQMLVCNDDANFPAPNDRASLVTFNFTQGETYYVRISGYNGASGMVNVRPSFYYSYPNDTCAGALPVSAGDHTFGNCGAHTENAAVQCPDSFVSHNDLWYAFTPDVSGDHFIHTCGSSFDTVMSVFNSCGGSSIACDDDYGGGCESLSAGVTVNLIAGQTYKICVGAFSPAASGAFNLSIVPPAPACDPDLDQNGVADQDDVSYLINVIAGGANPTGIDPDFDQNGVADQDDIAALVNVVAGGNCP